MSDDADLGGEAPCLLGQVCPECGQVIEAEPHTCSPGPSSDDG